jgi:predicted nucleic-acid-binding Zn-ribbon protein
MTFECPKCRSRMEEGFIEEVTRNAIRAAKWIEGPPEERYLFGLKTTPFIGLNTKGKRQYEVTTYRCTRCGYLELYAR